MTTYNTTVYPGLKKIDNLLNGDTDNMRVYGNGTGTVNVHGSDTVNLVAHGFNGGLATANINTFAAMDIATGTVDASYANVNITGPGAFVNLNTSVVADHSIVNIATAVMGSGKFQISNGEMRFSAGPDQRVAAGETVNILAGGDVKVGNLALYQAATVMGPTAGEKLELFLPTAASWKNMGVNAAGQRTIDFLDISGKVVGELSRLTVQDLQGFHVDKGLPASGLVSITTNLFMQEGSHGTLPIHG